MHHPLTEARTQRARAIAAHGGLDAALASNALPPRADLTLSEAIVLGLLRQDVRNFLGVFGHGTTEVGEVLRIYAEAGVVRVFGVRHETEAAHAATALRWVTGEKCAVFTSIGPGALNALTGALPQLSDGLGVWYLLGDETTEDEGPNMQQIAKPGQGHFLRLFESLGAAYSLHTPGAVATALRYGGNTVDHPYRPGPFFLLLPMNTQPILMRDFNLRELPGAAPPKPGICPAPDIRAAAKAIRAAKSVVVKVGGGARNAGPELLEFLELADAVAVTSPLVSGVIPFAHPRNMTVGGSKGSISGNFAMEEADLAVTLGTRAVCQSDCSRTGYLKAKQIVSINADLDAATHYNSNISLVGDAAMVLRGLNNALIAEGAAPREIASSWFKTCRAKRIEWDIFRVERYACPTLYDEVWGRKVLTQPAAIKAASDWARENGAVSFFDAGDVQANGFQIVEDDRLGRTFTETGASHMGFAVSAVLATALAETPFYALAFTGDGSFTMNPQILIDGVAHGARGCILLFDNRRMGAICGLQEAQYGQVFATSDTVEVDYVAWAAAIKGVRALHGGYKIETLLEALNAARAYEGLSLIHVPVYYGPDPLGGMGVFGRWNVGNWCEDTQALRHRIGL